MKDFIEQKITVPRDRASSFSLIKYVFYELKYRRNIIFQGQTDLLEELKKRCENKDIDKSLEQYKLLGGGLR